MLRKIFIFLFLGFFVFSAKAENSTIIISEIAWMGSVNSANDEWIELYNASAQNINLEGWRLAAQDGSPNINLSGTISAGGYFLLERTDDDSAPEAAADQIYSGALSNSGEILELYDNNGLLVDIVSAQDGWSAGDNDLKLTMQKLEDAWRSSDNPGGTPRAANQAELEAVAPKASTEDPAPESSGSSSGSSSSGSSSGSSSSGSSSDQDIQAQTPAAASYSAAIIISEIFPNPRGDDLLEEFIELYNTSDQDINLWGYQLGDNSETKYRFPKDVIIKAKNYLTVPRSQSKIALNNSGDAAKLYLPLKEKALRSLDYKKAPEGLSLALIDLDWRGHEWTKILTPGQANIIQKENAPPEADFSFAPSPYVFLNTVLKDNQILIKTPFLFDASDTADENESLSYVWDFGDGASSTLKNPEHIFLEPGKYTIKLSADDGRFKNTKEKNIQAIALENKPSNPINAKLNTVKAPAKIKPPSNPAPLAPINTALAQEENILSQNLEISLAEAKNLEPGWQVKTQGTVSVLPGILGAQFFYAADPEGAAGMQIYNYYKDFPRLAIGDLIWIQGEISQSGLEKRIKTKTKSDIIFIKKSSNPIPREIETGAISPEIAGELIKASGLITNKKGQNIYLDDGSGEVLAYIKPAAKISLGEIQEGDNYQITGIVSAPSAGVRILPRQLSDIVLLSQEGAASNFLGSQKSAQNQLSADLNQSQINWQLPENNKQLQFLKYLLVVSGGIIAALAGLLWKKNNSF